MRPIQFIRSIFKKERDENISNDKQYLLENEIPDFIAQLKQVIKWTEKLSKDFDFENGFYGTIFRQTNPIVNGTRLYTFDGDYATWNLDDYDNVLYEKLLETAINSRDKNYNVDLATLDDLGRIICFQTCCTTHDGVPIVESKCFVDESDVPPIDTWFYLINDYHHSEYRACQTLFCWIPKQFEKVMEEAMSIEIFDSYCWLDINNNSIYNLIKNDS